MKRIAALALTGLLLFGMCACGGAAQDSAVSTGGTQEGQAAGFTKIDRQTFCAPDGTVYQFLANEGFLCYFGEREYVGGVEGEAAENGRYSSRPGFYSIRGDDSGNVLIGVSADSEWNSFYRKASLPPFDCTVDNCVRLELVFGLEPEEKHVSCGGGITDPAEISAFLSELRAQQTPQDAGLYELVQKPDGFLGNCYLCGVIYGFFEEEPYLAVPMYVTSYNDLAYSVSIGQEAYVLPEQWFLRLQQLADN